MCRGTRHMRRNFLPPALRRNSAALTNARIQERTCSREKLARSNRVRVQRSFRIRTICARLPFAAMKKPERLASIAIRYLSDGRWRSARLLTAERTRETVGAIGVHFFGLIYVALKMARGLCNVAIPGPAQATVSLLGTVLRLISLNTRVSIAVSLTSN